MCFFFKQKTAYELRISDWSSDVCSSDLHGGPESRGWSGYLQELLRQLALAAGINVRDSAILGIVEAGDVEVEPSDLHAHRDLMIVVPRVPKRRLACLAPQPEVERCVLSIPVFVGGSDGRFADRIALFISAHLTLGFLNRAKRAAEGHVWQ